MYKATQEYTLSEYIRPVWEGDTVAHETVLFREDEHAACLLYPIDEILAVFSADLKTKYEEGIDYALEYGCIVRLPGSRMPYIPLEKFYPSVHEDWKDFPCCEVGHPLLGFGEGDTMVQYMVDITYRHSSKWNGPKVPDQSAKLSRFLSKLKRGEEATIVFYGDSITTGANSSGVIGTPPHAPCFAQMVTFALAEKYGYEVSLDVHPAEPMKTIEKKGGKVLHYVNTAVGGMDSNWGLENVGTHVNDYQPDLVILAFGMNDGGKTRDHYMDLTRRTVESMQSAVPDADIILLATMLPHWRAPGFFGHQIEYEDALKMYADAHPNTAIAPMTSVHKHILTRKQYYHASGNNINHPSDFLARVYAMVLLGVLGY